MRICIDNMYGHIATALKVCVTFLTISLFYSMLYLINSSCHSSICPPLTLLIDCWFFCFVFCFCVLSNFIFQISFKYIARKKTQNIYHGGGSGGGVFFLNNKLNIAIVKLLSHCISLLPLENR